MNLAFVLLREARLPRLEQVASAFEAYASDGHPLLPRPSGTDAPDGEGSLAFGLAPGETAVVGLMPAPVPGNEAEAAAQFSVSALGTGWSLPPHSAHLGVVMKGDGDAQTVDGLSRFTSLLAAIVQATQAVGVYWGAAGATHDGGFFTDLAREPEIASRIMLWTGVSIAREPGGRLSLLSRGMQQLALPDLLLTARPAQEALEALEVFFKLLTYVAERGQALPEGDTIGRDENEKLTVHYVPSPVNGGAKVWRIDLE